MKLRNYGNLLPVLIMTVILTGCKNKEIQHHDDTNSTENTVFAENVVNDKPQESHALFGKNCITEQTFSVELSEYEGEVSFVPYAPSDGNSKFFVEIIQNRTILTTINAYIPDNLTGETFTSLDAVSFWDINYDNSTDILLIQTYGDKSFASVYYGFTPDAYDFERYFIAQPKLSDTLTEKVSALTVNEIRNLISDNKKNGSFSDYKEAFYYVTKLAALEGYVDLGYNLIYFDEDDIPELVTGKESYYVSLYTYKDGTLYMPMNRWAYGVSGNVGYEYVPYKNSLRNYNTEYAGAILYTTYSTMNDQYFMDTVAEVKLVNFDDVNENGILDPEEEGSFASDDVAYLNGEKVHYKECEKYDVGEYELIRPVLSVEELLNMLDK